MKILSRTTATVATSLIASLGYASPAQAKGAAVSDDAYYIVTHLDQRKCAFPLCGGVFIKRVNRFFTQCADGSWNFECHAAVTDLSSLGLADPAAFQKSFEASQALVHGQLVALPGASKWPVDTLVAAQAWLGVTGNPPLGGFANLTDNGLLCLVPPCESFDAAFINTASTIKVAEVDLAASGASDDQVNAGFTELFNSSIIVAGYIYPVSGPGGHAWGYGASEFYHRLDHTACTLAADTCGKGTYCSVPDYLCGDGKGTCEPFPEACTDIYDPVCGCDNQTYGNACYAAIAGVSVASAGVCSCTAMDAKGVGPCDLFLGWSFDGTACVPLSGCSCEGNDCDSLYAELDQCEAACLSADPTR